MAKPRMVESAAFSEGPDSLLEIVAGNVVIDVEAAVAALVDSAVSVVAAATAEPSIDCNRQRLDPE